jgi:hypothetical protein
LIHTEQGVFSANPKGRLLVQPQKSRFQQTLLTVLVVLFVLTLAALNYANWSAEQGASGLVQPWMLLINILILSIPLVLLYGSIYVLLMGWHERSMLGKVVRGDRDYWSLVSFLSSLHPIQNLMPCTCQR